jgi:hypothetical protein
MAIGSGLGSSLGMAVETTYGTYVAPTRWHEIEGGFPFKKVPHYVQSKGMGAGRLVPRSARRVLTHEEAEGQFTSEVTHKEFGRVLNLLMGGSVSPVQQGATAAYLQTHTLLDHFGKMATWQVGVPDVGGTVRPHTFLGCKVKSVEFTCEVGGQLMAAVEWDARQFTEGQSLVAPSYTASLKPFHFVQGTVKLGTVGAEAAVSAVKKLSLKIERPMNTERQYFGQAGLKKEPISNAPVVITGSAEVDYETKADFADRFHNSTGTSLVWEFTGAVIESPHSERITFKTPAIFLTGDTPTIEGHDVVSTTFPFEVDDNGTNNPLTIEYVSTDTAL